MKNHRKLLLGFSTFLSDGAKITIPPEADQHITSARAKMTIPPKAEQHITSAKSKMTIPPEAKQHIASDNNKRKRVKCDDPDYDPDFVNKLKVKNDQVINYSGSQMKLSQSQRYTQQV
ncbi:hypothetical protein CARUB_v10011800mg [Capsella rubella]|uniref:Uncharacterized protein n=1 Tax=Capsella rubella TaxID=81985 RepID=R0IEE0_9BRAS|nr:hypothetical protein CARUB_v10011800mg [Capsella rubella]